MIEIPLNLKPLPANQMYRQFKGRTIKSKKYREWVTQVEVELLPYQGILSDFKKTFNDKTDGILLTFEYASPKFLTKKGVISKTNIDLDNCLKCLIDVVFNFMDVNDAFIVQINAKKLYGDKECTYLGLESTRVVF